MTQVDAYFLRKKIKELDCYNEESIKKLYSFISFVKRMYDFIEFQRNKYSIESISNYSPEQIAETESYLLSWIKHPKKSTLQSTFKEYKRDIEIAINDCILFADAHNIWE